MSKSTTCSSSTIVEILSLSFPFGIKFFSFTLPLKRNSQLDAQWMAVQVAPAPSSTRWSIWWEEALQWGPEDSLTAWTLREHSSSCSTVYWDKPAEEFLFLLKIILMIHWVWLWEARCAATAGRMPDWRNTRLGCRRIWTTNFAVIRHPILPPELQLLQIRWKPVRWQTNSIIEPFSICANCVFSMLRCACLCCGAWPLHLLWHHPDGDMNLNCCSS